MPYPAKRDIAKAKAGRTAAARQARVRLSLTRKKKVRVVDAELQNRLIQSAYTADTGEGTDTTGMSDDEFLALLRR